MTSWPPDAAKFLTAFLGSKTFQTFDDRPEKDRTLSRVLHDPELSELKAYNARYAGIFLMMNEGDGTGRKSQNVRRVRTLSADFDKSPPPTTWPLEPSMIVQTSPGRSHAYWVLRDDEEFPLDKKLFNQQQEAIARAVGGEPHDCKGLSRVMRVPGFIHWKSGNPYHSFLIHPAHDDPIVKYSVEEIRKAFPVPTVRLQSSAPVHPSAANVTAQQTERQRNYASRVLARECDAVRRETEGGRNNKLNSAAFRLGQLIGGGSLSEQTVVAALSDAGRASGLPDSEVQQTVRSGVNAGIARPVSLAHIGAYEKADPQNCPNGKERRQPSVSGRLLALIEQDDMELWRDRFGEAYATVHAGEHVEHYRVESAALREYLKYTFWKQEGSALPGPALSETLGALQARARYEGQVYVTGTRVIHLNGRTYVDLGNADWDVVEVSHSGWSVIDADQSPVRFVRSAGMLPLPVPVHGGDLEDLRPFLSVDEEGFVLCVAWLLGAISGLSPYPLLALSGEQGSGKSVSTSVLRRLIDPHQADRRRAPRDERDLFIAARHSHVLNFDNLSSISNSLSDALCVISTSGASSARTLYRDTEETVLLAVRPVILNGIPDLLARPDLAERALSITVQRLSSEQRRPEAEFWAEYEAVCPQLLGSLLSALAYALARLETTVLVNPPRMADFARLVVAAEGELPWPPGTFMRAYELMRGEATLTVLDGDDVAEAIRALVDHEQEWFGSLHDLLPILTRRRFPDGRIPRTWPMSPRALGGQLRRILPALREVGYIVEARGRGTAGRYRYRFARDQTFTTFTMVPAPAHLMGADQVDRRLDGGPDAPEELPTGSDGSERGPSSPSGVGDEA